MYMLSCVVVLVHKRYVQFLRNKDEALVGEIEANFFMISNVQCYYECDLLSVLFDEVGGGIALALFLWRRRRERKD